jgi:hypothetical protein
LARPNPAKEAKLDDCLAVLKSTIQLQNRAGKTLKVLLQHPGRAPGIL